MNTPKTDSEYQAEAERILTMSTFQMRKLEIIPLLRARDERDALWKSAMSDVIRLNPLRKELAVIKESRAVVVDQEQISRIESNRLRAENDALKAELASLKTVAKVASTSPCRHSSAYTSFSCPTCQALESHSAKGYKLE